MADLADYRPRFSLEEATRLAEALYGVSGVARPLPSERDQNFYLTTLSGDGYVLKISSAAERRDILDFQNAALEHLRIRQGDGVWPEVARTRMGDCLTSVTHEKDRHMVRMLGYLPGKPLVDTKPHSSELLYSLGVFLGRMSASLADFSYPATQQDLKWNMDNGPSVLREGLPRIADLDRRALAAYFLTLFEQIAADALPTLRRSIVHNDPNDYNVLVSAADPGNPGSWEKRVSGLIDFGDMVHSYTLSDLAIGLAYAMLGKADPLAAASHVVRGYHSVFPLTEKEIELLLPFAALRLCMSVVISAQQQAAEPENRYLSVTEAPAWALLARLQNTPFLLAHYLFRHVCGLPPCPKTPALESWLRRHTDDFFPVMGREIDLSRGVVFDLSPGSGDLAMMHDRSDVHEFTELLFGKMKTAGAPVGIGRYNEARQIYAGDLFSLDSDEMPERRTIHLGIDLFLPAGAPVYAPLDGIVHSFRNNTAAFDYGPCILLEHRAGEDGPVFYTLYGHLSVESLDGLYVGRAVRTGERIATLGDHTVNGRWPPHLHFQIVTDLLGRIGEFPGVAAPTLRAVWLSIDPDPNLILGIPDWLFPPPERSSDDILRTRRAHIGRSLSISYRNPLKIIRGYGQYLYDEAG
ncbi:MAG: phosphotransferase, partial [candidate division Zixibacteria bacterium]|nr:phosphotransferase [candidate division Zixibacteria bacterium]